MDLIYKKIEEKDKEQLLHDAHVLEGGKNYLIVKIKNNYLNLLILY